MGNLRAGASLPPAMFLLVFPVFFAYQALAAFAVIPPVIGGGLTIFTAIALVALAPLVLWRVREFWPAVAVLSALSAIVLAYAAFYRLFGLDYQRDTENLLSSVKLVAAWGGLFCIGLLLKPSEQFRRVLFWAVIFMAAVTPFLIKTPALSLIDTVRAGWNVASYQFFAGAFVFTAMLAIAYSWGRRSEPWLVAVSLATIVLLLSRSEQGGMLAVAAGWVGARLMVWQWRPVLIAAAASVVLVSASLLLVPFIPALTVNLPIAGAASVDGSPSAAAIVQRQMELTNIAGSESWGERGKFLSEGLDDIVRSPIIGDYAGQIRDFGFSGAYIHNVLSAWRQYGIVAFLIYLGSTIAAFAFPAWRVLRGNRDPEWLAASMVSGFTLLLVVFAKPVYWPMPALAWGMSSALFVRTVLHHASQRHATKAAVAPTMSEATISATTT